MERCTQAKMVEEYRFVKRKWEAKESIGKLETTRWEVACLL